jgi:predicted RNA binding protein YcfA (HicA-like mRNA interferase family)
MPPRQFSSREVLKVLYKAGYRRSNASGGSHVVVTKKDHGGNSYNVTIPMGKDPIPPGTIRSIASQAGSQDFDEFCKWIDRER